jgi:hypothetical protein
LRSKELMKAAEGLRGELFKTEFVEIAESF